MASTGPQINKFDAGMMQQMDVIRNEILACAERDRDALELNLKVLDYMEHMHEVLTEVIASMKKYQEQLLNLNQERYNSASEPSTPK